MLHKFAMLANTALGTDCVEFLRYDLSGIHGGHTRASQSKLQEPVIAPKDSLGVESEFLSIA